MSRSHVSQQQEKGPLNEPNFPRKEEEVYSNRSPSERLQEKPTESHRHPQLRTYQDIIEAVAMEIRADGISGLLGFANQLKVRLPFTQTTDYEKTHLISCEKLCPILLYLSEPNVRELLRNFNPNKFGEINYAELVYGLKGNMNLQRQALVDDLFNMLDVEQIGEIEIAKIIASYKNRSEIGAFKRAIDQYCKFQSIDDGIFTDEDFNDFFEFLSFSFRDDQAFSEFVKVGFYTGEAARSTVSSRSSKREFDVNRENSQRSQNMAGVMQQKEAQETADFRKNKVEQKAEELKESAYRQLNYNEESDKKSHVSEAASRRSEPRSGVEIPEVKEINMILMRMKKTLASKGTRGFLQFEKQLKHADTDADGRVSLDEFKSVVKELKIDITNVEATQLFAIFDQEKAGRFDYQEVLQTLRGHLPAQRREIINRMWEKVRINADETTFSRVKQALNFRSHPDVQNGRKYEDQIWNEIQETLLMIQDLNEKPRCDVITRDNFDEYAENLSLSIADDGLFESIALNFWKIGSIVRIEEEYAGSRKVFDPAKKGYLQDHHRYALNGGTVSQNAPFGTFSTPTVYTTEHHRL